VTRIAHDDARPATAPNLPASGTELAVWTLVVLIAAPFGVFIAAVLAFTRLRQNRVARWLILGLSIAIIALLVLGIIGAASTGSIDGYTGPEHRVN
jgi:hypothetical protein